MTFRRTNRNEAGSYRKIRLESLRESPEAFCSTYDEAVLRSQESWEVQASQSAAGSDRATFFAMHGDPVGLAAIYRDEKIPVIGDLIQVWVAPEHRGTGTAEAFINFAISWAAQQDFQTIRAEVTPSNSQVIGFYERLGFLRVEEAHIPQADVVLDYNLQSAPHQAP